MGREPLAGGIELVAAAIAAYVCLLCFSAGGGLGCMNCAGASRQDLYGRAPAALALVAALSWLALRERFWRMARIALMVSGGFWIAAVGLDRGWW